MSSLTDTLCNWDLIGCTPNCRRPLRRWRWRAPRIWTCPGCHTRWTLEGRRWATVMSATQFKHLEGNLGLGKHQE
ncbi:hypothetical protein [Streptomyces sp. LN245]|uniref:hypothetical protein n=1 Tax=Streptomyces sp. LN245 TaxID=3112975 RepID=UPI003712FDF9